MKISRRKVCSIFIFSQVFYIKNVESKREKESEGMNGEESEMTRNKYHPKNYNMKGEHIL